MSEPKRALEDALYVLLVDAATGYTVYNSEARGASGWDYIVFSPAGSDESGYLRKKRHAVYRFEIVGLSTSRNTAMLINQAIDAVMDTAPDSLAVSNATVIYVLRSGTIDRQERLSGALLYRIGGIYEIELQIDD